MYITAAPLQHTNKSITFQNRYVYIYIDLKIDLNDPFRHVQAYLLCHVPEPRAATYKHPPKKY